MTFKMRHKEGRPQKQVNHLGGKKQGERKMKTGNWSREVKERKKGDLISRCSRTIRKEKAGDANANVLKHDLFSTSWN